MFKVVVTLLLLSVSQCSQGFVQSQLRGAQQQQLEELQSVQTIEEFALGFIFQFQFLQRVPDVLTCVGDVTKFTKEIAAAKALIKQGGLLNVIAGVQQISQAVKSLLDGCDSTIQETFQYFHDIVAQLTTPGYPKIALKRVWDNLEKVAADVKGFVQYKKDNDWIDAGGSIGDIASILVWGEANSMEVPLV